MKLKKRLFSAILSAILLAGSIGFQCINPEKTGNTDIPVVSESLSNYLFGYMSWGVKHIGLDSMQEKIEKSGKNLKEVRVAVIDSGLNTSNKYLKGRYTNDGYSFLNNNTDINDEGTHGTMVSGIIIDGTSSNVKVLPIKVNDKNGRGKMSNVEKGIYYAIEHKADVINLSLSSSDADHTMNVLDKAIDAAVKKGIVVIVAAGNQGGDVADRYPANKKNVLTITSIDKNNKIPDKANTGKAVDFALPGSYITAPYKTFAFVDSGTSLAAPHAAAAAAMLKTIDKSLNQEQVLGILKHYTVDYGEKGFDTQYGWGVLDLSKFDLNIEPIKPYVTGDVNHDRVVNINDATDIQKHIARWSMKTFYKELADVDDDSEITIRDVTMLQRQIASM